MVAGYVSDIRQDEFDGKRVGSKEPVETGHRCGSRGNWKQWQYLPKDPQLDSFDSTNETQETQNMENSHTGNSQISHTSQALPSTGSEGKSYPSYQYPPGYSESLSNISNSSSEGTPHSGGSLPTCVVAPSAPDSLSGDERAGFIPSRKQREFIPENKKDNHYWDKRRKNNEAARRSREKRRYHDVALENRIMDLTRDNCQLRNELFAIKKRYKLPLNEQVTLSDDDNTQPVTTASVMPPSTNAELGMGSSVSSMLASALNQQTAHQSAQSMLALAGGIPVTVPFGAALTNNGPMPFYVPVPTSDAYKSSMIQQYATQITDKPVERIPAHTGAALREERSAPFPISTSGGMSHAILNTADSQGSPSISTSKTLPDSCSASHLPLRPGDSIAASWALVTGNKSQDASDDYEQDEPLSLTMSRRNSDVSSGNESCSSNYSNDIPRSRSPTMTLPLKLRHKIPQDGSYLGARYPSYVNGLTQLSEIALAHTGPLAMEKSSRSRSYSPQSSDEKDGNSNDPRSSVCPKYAERRRRNNEAARKCRENRKTLTSLREVKSDYLETENGKLRNELDSLQEEMKQLRELIERRRFGHEVKKEHMAHQTPSTVE